MEQTLRNSLVVAVRHQVDATEDSFNLKTNPETNSVFEYGTAHISSCTGSTLGKLFYQRLKGTFQACLCQSVTSKFDLQNSEITFSSLDIEIKHFGH